jgi:crotonobetaine/carnitine-CoA ligase
MIKDPLNIPLEQRLIGPLLTWRAETEKDRTFIEVDQRSWSFAEVNFEVQALARGLKDLGLNTQDSVALILPNCIEMVLSWFSCSLLRAINIPINPILVGEILAKPFKDSKSRFLIIHEEFTTQLATLHKDILNNLEQVIIVGNFEKDSLPVGPKNYISFESLLIREGKRIIIEADYRDIQTVFYTSGTTGPAKGVQTLNAHQFSAACGFAKAVALNKNDILFTAYPLFHGLAARLGVLPCLLVGAKVVIDRKLSTKNFWQKVVDCKATVAHSIFSLQDCSLINQLTLMKNCIV